MNKWQEFKGESFEIVDLGRPAVFFVPAQKLKGENGAEISQNLHLFLVSQFDAYSTSLAPSFGLWKDSEQRIVSDECIVYEVSFVGKDKIPILLKKLAELCIDLKEECIYLKAGQHACLVYPKRS